MYYSLSPLNTYANFLSLKWAIPSNLWLFYYNGYYLPPLTHCRYLHQILVSIIFQFYDKI